MLQAPSTVSTITSCKSFYFIECTFLNFTTAFDDVRKHISLCYSDSKKGYQTMAICLGYTM